MAQQNPQQTAQPKPAKKPGMGFWGVLLTAVIVSLAVSVVTDKFVMPWLDGIFKQKVEVPNVRGAKVEHARMMLESSVLFMSIMGEAHDNEVPAGDVASQTPLAGSMADKKSTVTLVISKGKPKVRIPVLLQLPLEEAKSQLAALGLAAGEVVNKQSAAVPAGRVISSDPQAGAEADKGATVNLTVSAGVKIVRVIAPSLKGKTIDEAQRLLSQKGLILGKISKKTDENADFDIILAQSPQAGASVVKGSVVSVTINAEGSEE